MPNKKYAQNSRSNLPSVYEIRQKLNEISSKNDGKHFGPKS